MDYSYKYLKYKKKYLDLKKNRFNGQLPIENGHLNKHATKLILGNSSLSNLTNDKISINKNKKQKGGKKQETFSEDEFESLAFAEGLLRFPLYAMEKGKNSIYNKISDYWAKNKNGMKFFETTNQFSVNNSIVNSDASKEEGKLVFDTNDGKSYVVDGLLMAMYVPKYQDKYQILRWVWSIANKSDTYKKIYDEIKKHPELENDGLFHDAQTFENFTKIDEWYYMLLLAYFTKGIGFLSIIIEGDDYENPNRLYFIINSINKYNP